AALPGVGEAPRSGNRSYNLGWKVGPACPEVQSGCQITHTSHTSDPNSPDPLNKRTLYIVPIDSFLHAEESPGKCRVGRTFDSLCPNHWQEMSTAAALPQRWSECNVANPDQLQHQSCR